jgi:hypothetical protein
METSGSLGEFALSDTATLYASNLVAAAILSANHLLVNTYW